LNALKVKYSDIIVDVRGKGLMLGLKFAEKYDVKDGVEALKKRGLLTATAGDNVIRMVPPLIISKAEAQEGLEIIESWLKTL
jgi:acetylornithine/succinyldiaminopimelate/putrescine aminotransferase